MFFCDTPCIIAPVLQRFISFFRACVLAHVYQCVCVCVYYGVCAEPSASGPGQTLAFQLNSFKWRTGLTRCVFVLTLARAGKNASAAVPSRTGMVATVARKLNTEGTVVGNRKDGNEF